MLLFHAADGKCQGCGEELRPDWHADHKVPYSQGGRTEVSNGQALCPGCNLSKGRRDSDGRLPARQPRPPALDIALVRTRRLHLGMRQEDVAAALGVDRSAIAQWERGRGDPETRQLLPLAKLLHITADELLAKPENDGPKVVAS
jgi:DNA-binding XRE family transcriptional regulator